MKFVSTRGETPALGFSDAVATGLAPDGGLYLPESFPKLPIAALRGKSPEEVAPAKMLKAYRERGLSKYKDEGEVA